MTWLFLPGLHCTSEIFDATSRWVDEHVVVLDWPWPERIRDMEEAADWLERMLRRYDPSGLTGHSFGGVLALYLERSRGHGLPMIIVDAFMTWPDPFFRNHTWEAQPSVVARVHEMLGAQRPRFPHLRRAAMSFEPSPEWGLEVWGTRSEFLYGGRSGEHDAQEIARLAGLPEAGDRVQVVDGASHFLMWERPERFYELHRRAMDRLL